MDKGKLPPVDLRALALSATAASPLLAWNIADAWSDNSAFRGSFLEIAADQIEHLVYLLTAAFGNVFVAVGGALYLQRNAPRQRPFSFITTALAIVGVLVALNATMLGLQLVAVEVYSSGDETSSIVLALKQRALMRLVLSNTALLAVVGVAARLYLAWRREPPEPKDGARVVVLGGVGFGVGLAYVLWWSILAPAYDSEVANSLPIRVLWWMQITATSIVDGIGAAFLVGCVAIALVRKAQVEERLFWVTAAALLGSLAYWLVTYGPALAQDMAYIADPIRSYLRSFLTAIAAGLIGGPAYLYATNREALRKTLTIPGQYLRLAELAVSSVRRRVTGPQFSSITLH